MLMSGIWIGKSCTAGDWTSGGPWVYIIFQCGLSTRSLQHVASGEPYMVVKAPKASVLRERKPGGSRIIFCDLSLEGVLSLLLVKAIAEASPV